MKPMIFASLLIAAVSGGPAMAGEFSEGSKAASWNLFGEDTALFEGKVVDALCLLTGDCPADCGAGKRQVGILRSADGKFLLATKNIQPAFTGATVDLAPYCGQTVEVDGLLVGDPEITPGLGTARLYQVQTVRIVGTEKAEKTDRWTGDWAERNPDAPGEGPWFKRDPHVNAQIEAHGRLGLGAEADAKYVEDNF